MSPDEQILVLLADGPAGTQDLATSMDWHDRSVRRRLRRLIRDGYVFSPSRGLYRLTSRGRAAVEDDHEDEGKDPSDPGDAQEDEEDWPRHPFERWMGGSSRR